MAIIDVAMDVVKSKGWLSLASLYFDNSYEIKLAETGGHIAYSPSKDVVYNISNMDTELSDLVATRLITTKESEYGHLATITMTGGDHLQHFDAALYHFYKHYSDAYTNCTDLDYPNLPTAAECMAGTIKPDVVTTLLNKTQLEGKRLFTTNLNDPAIRIDYWKEFYDNQYLFKEFIKANFGVSDLI